jgi:GNAT superfamily N-acetyltransferase
VTELHTEAFPSANDQPSLFEFPLISAVLEKKQQGKVFADRQVQPENMFVLHKAGFAYFYSNEQSDYSEWLNFLLQEINIPPYFHIYDPPLTLQNEACNNSRFGHKLRRRIQLQYIGKRIDPSIFKPAIKVHVDTVNPSNFHELEAFDLNISHKFWNSKEDFLEQGYGILLRDEQQLPAALCYSACVSNGLAEVDIVTLPDYQNKGLAKYAAALFVAAGLERGITTNWDCFENNSSSLRTAQKIGFTTSKEYSFVSLYKNKL